MLLLEIMQKGIPKRIRIIVDSAGGHSVGKTDQNGLERSLRDVRNWIKNSKQGESCRIMKLNFYRNRHNHQI